MNKKSNAWAGLSRRDLLRQASALGIGVAAMGALGRKGWAAENLTSFTWSGYEIKELHPAYSAKYPQEPNFAFFSDEEEALQKVRGGFHPDLIHPCINTVSRFREASVLKRSTPRSSRPGAQSSRNSRKSRRAGRRPGLDRAVRLGHVVGDLPAGRRADFRRELARHGRPEVQRQDLLSRRAGQRGGDRGPARRRQRGHEPDRRGDGAGRRRAAQAPPECALLLERPGRDGAGDGERGNRRRMGLDVVGQQPDQERRQGEVHEPRRRGS